MVCVFNVSLRITIISLDLFLFVQLPLISASGLLQSNNRETYQDSYSSNSGRELSTVDDKLLNKDKLHLEAGRKLLQNVVREETVNHQKTRPSERKKDYKSFLTSEKLAIAVPGIVVCCCVFLCPCFYARRKKTAHTVLPKELVSMDSFSSDSNSVSARVLASPMRVPPSPSRFSMSPKITRVGSIHLNMNEAARATQNFSPSLRLGEGGFGTVYKAQLQDGQIVAIKLAKKADFEALRSEFESEVELLATINHRSLVKLLGFVDKGNDCLIITEYVANGTLREHLDGLRGDPLDFNQRLEIAMDVAHGLTYLHVYAEKQIIHRDVKSSNILLTDRMRAKLTDFGFARLADMDPDNTHASAKVKGTMGYLDPEYMKTHHLTPKIDVYSFGILLIEILTGRRPLEPKRPVNERVTVRWAFANYTEGSIKEMVDPLMKEEVDIAVLQKMFDLAIQCVAPTGTDRPDMKSVGEHLWGIRVDYIRSRIR